MTGDNNIDFPGKKTTKQEKHNKEKGKRRLQEKATPKFMPTLRSVATVPQVNTHLVSYLKQ